MIYWLVVWNMAFIFHFIYGIIFSIDELIFFKMVIAPPTSIGCEKKTGFPVDFPNPQLSGF
jgi:hypothetical protein